MADVTLVAKRIRPPRLRIDRFRFLALRAMDNRATKIMQDFLKTVETWQEERPNFTRALGTRGGNLEVLVGPSGNTKGVQKWVWLNEGTKVRYAVMTRDFIAKTKPGTFSSGPGKGGKAFMSLTNPRPGIQPRGWTKKGKDKHEPRFKRDIEKVMRDFNRTGWQKRR